jgi:hypothetical protein
LHLNCNMIMYQKGLISNLSYFLGTVSEILVLIGDSSWQSG